MASTLSEDRTRHALERLFRTAKESLLVASPFVAIEGISLANAAISDDFRAYGELTFLTNLSPRNICETATDPRALLALSGNLQGMRLYHLPTLHAKVYIADLHLAIVGSAGELCVRSYSAAGSSETTSISPNKSSWVVSANESRFLLFGM